MPSGFITYRRRIVGAVALLLAAPLAARAQGTSQPGPQPDGSRLKIGVIGSGHIGSTLGRLWVKAGHPVMFASRHPDMLKEMAQELGPLASTGTPKQAAEFGDVVLIAVPYGALPQLGRDLAGELRGKIVLDPNNAVASRDGAELVQQVESRGIGAVSAEYLPGTRLVRVFNALNWLKLANDNHRTDPVAIPLAGNDPEAVRIAEQLVRDAGFAPVLVGDLNAAARFQAGTPGYRAVQEELSAAELRRRLGMD